MLLFQQMIVFFCIMAVGYLCCKIKALDTEASKKLSWIVVNVSNPALVIASGLSEDKLPKEVLPLVAVIILVYYAALIGIAQIIPYVIRVKRDSMGTYKIMTILCNLSFMGFPIITAMYGAGAVLYASLFCIPFNFIIYTYGVTALKKPESVDTSIQDAAASNHENFSLTHKKDNKRQHKDNYNKKNNNDSILKKVMNIGTISSVIGLVLYLLDARAPKVILQVCNSLGGLTGPLSMMVIGIMLAGIDIKEMFTDVKLIVFSLIKLLVIPTCALPIMNMFIPDPVIRGVTLVMIATPVAAMTAMMAQQYEGDYETASKGVALSTILSVVTIPIMFAIAF